MIEEVEKYTHKWCELCVSCLRSNDQRFTDYNYVKEEKEEMRLKSFKLTWNGRNEKKTSPYSLHIYVLLEN